MLVSIIIPCGIRENTGELERDIANQKICFDTELIHVCGVSPSGKARNIGAGKAAGEILVFIDSDIRLGSEFVLANLIKTLYDDDKIGIASSSIRLPLGASGFQILYAKQIPNCQTPIVDTLTDAGVSTSACCAIRKEVFFASGEFNENLVRGLDPELSFRLRKSGYRTVLAAQTFSYHPQPADINELVKIHFRNGLAVAFVDIFYPEMNIDVNPKGIIYAGAARKSKFSRIIRYMMSFLRAFLGGRFLLFLSKIVYLCGYAAGFFLYNRRARSPNGPR